MDPSENSTLKEIKTPEDIPAQYKGTPLEKLILYHNFHDEYKDKIGPSEAPEMVIAMCMDFRHQLKTPENFAYIMRTAGANIMNLDFMVSVAVGAGKTAHMAIIGHNDCAMAHLDEKKENMIEGLVNLAGWEAGQAADYFARYAPSFTTGNAAEFTTRQTRHYQKFYPGVQVASLYYKFDDHKLWLIK